MGSPGFHTLAVFVFFTICSLCIVSEIKSANKALADELLGEGKEAFKIPSQLHRHNSHARAQKRKAS